MSPASMIAIDGPAASGKTTLGRRLASELRYLFFDTGAMYRAATLACLDGGISIEDQQQVTQVASSISIDLRPASQDDGRNSDVFLDGEEVTWRIRAAPVDEHVSLVSSYPGVRQAMTSRQRQIGLRGQVVMVGRDIGTVVLPEADLKIYLDASTEARARRRYLEGVTRGEPADYDEILQSMQARDQFDSSRALAPLKPAADSFVIDTTWLSPDDVLALMLDLAHGRLGEDIGAPDEDA